MYHFIDVIVNVLSGLGTSPAADKVVASDSDMTLWEVTDLSIHGIPGLMVRE